MRGTRRRRRRKQGQAGGASASTVHRILRGGPSLQDKIAAGVSMFLLGPSPSFGKLGFLLGKQALKGIKDNGRFYTRGRIIRPDG